jgi:hypothetical protein
MTAYTQIGDNSPDGIQVGASTSSKVAFFGATPRAQVTASSAATSLVGTASSTAIDSNTKAAIIAVMNTLSALGIWPAQA